jgi:FMN reductase (NADPH)
LNQTIETIQKHVSVRAFTKQALSEEQVRQLVTIAQAASSASFQQAYTIIGVTDPALLQKIAVACNNLFITDGGHFFVFCADVNRHKQLADDAQVDISKALNGIDAILVGAIDAALAAQNMVIAAESMGLGACYIGGVRDGIIVISELLQIPDYVFPVFGLVVGYPNECNDHKPRIPFAAIYHVNGYNNNTKAILQQYDEEMRLYYATRSGERRNQTWSESAIRSFIRHSRGHMKKFLNDRGWAQD